MISRFSLAASFFTLAAGAFGSSFTLNPWILVFEPQKKTITQVVTFAYQYEGSGTGGKVDLPTPDDPQNVPVPVEINISARVITPEGNVTYPSNQGADDFVVYPSQFILYPGDTKKVQVQWVGAVIPEKEVSLGFISTQLPLKFKAPAEKPSKAIGKVEVQTRYEGIIVVRPSGVKPKVIVDSAYAREDSAGPSLVVVLNNTGTGLQSLKDLSLVVSPKDAAGKIKFGEKREIKGLKPMQATSQSILAGFRRKVSVPWPKEIPVGPVSVTAEFPETK